MPKFIYTVMLIAILFWVAWTSRFFLTPPDSSKNVILFLLLFFFAFTFTVSMPIYLHHHKKAPEFSNLRKIYRKSLKWSLLFAFGVIGIMALKAFNLFSAINLGLFTLLYLAVFFQMKDSRRV